MKKSYKIMIISVIVVISIMSLIYYFKLKKKYKITITNIKDGIITGATLHYEPEIFEYNLTNIYNENGNKLELKDLSIGDMVYCGDVKDDFAQRGKIIKIEENKIYVNINYLEYYSFDTSKINNEIIKKLEAGQRIEITNDSNEPQYATPYYGVFLINHLSNVKKVKTISNDKDELDAIENKDNFMMMEAIITEIDENYLTVSSTISSKKIKVIYSKDNLLNFKEQQKVLIFFNANIEKENVILSNVKII